MSYSSVLAFHISAGIAGMLSGGVTIFLRKGTNRHRVAGDVFVIAMMSMSISAIDLALIKNRMDDVFAAMFTIYLVATAWETARRGDGKPGIFEWAAFLWALATIGGYFIVGLKAASKPMGHAGNYFFMGFVVVLVAMGDLRMLMQGGISGVQRLVRHLWRMCFAWFMAAGSIFLARPHVFPEAIRKSHILGFLGMLPLLLMAFWLFRVRSRSAYITKAMPGTGYAAAHKFRA
jgi:uncharacterized membrane protein